MKTIFLGIILSIVILFSCSKGAKNNNENLIKESVVDNGCSCAELDEFVEHQYFGKMVQTENIKNLKTGALYTGSCYVKDQYDTIIMQKEIKNGLLIHMIEKEKISDGVYIKKFDMKYELDNDKTMHYHDGFTKHFSERELPSGKKVYYISEYSSYKNGSNYDGWAYKPNWSRETYDILFEIQLAGYQPILAHPERYLFYHNDFKEYEKIKNSGCLFQLNLLATVGYYGEKTAQISDKLLQNDFYDFVGSDIHHQNHVKAFSRKVNIKNVTQLESVIQKNLFFSE